MEREQVGTTKVEQQQDRPPFIIRAHHLDIPRRLLKNGMLVSDFVDSYFKPFKKKYVFLNILTTYSQWYVNDFLGSTQEQADKARRYNEEFLEEFLQLPSDYPVKIVEDQKDKICQGCAIGEHCDKRPMPSLSWFVTSDEKVIRSFRKAAKKLDLEDDLTVVEETATYSNSKPREVKSILTTAGTVKKVILSMSDWTFP